MDSRKEMQLKNLVLEKVRFQESKEINKQSLINLIPLKS